MKKLLGLAVLSVFLGGCSSSPTVANKAANTIDQANKDHVNANTETAANSTPENILTNETRANVKSARSLSPNETPGGIDMKNVKAVTAKNSAPDNSEVSATMNREGIPIETRIFKNHPVLLKTERVFVDIKNPTERVFLKNGKIVEVPPDKNINVSTALAVDILKAIGIPNNAAIKKEH